MGSGVNAAQLSPTDEETESHYRTIVYFEEPSKSKGYVRSYVMEDEVGSVLFSAEAFGQYFGRSVVIVQDPDTSAIAYTLKPNRKLVNNGFALVEDRSGETIAECSIRKKNGMAITDVRSGIELSTVIAYRKHTKTDRVIDQIDCGAPQREYFVKDSISELCYCDYSSRPNSESEQQFDTSTRFGRFKRWLRVSSDSCVFVDHTSPASAPADLTLFVLVMMHHEFMHARQNNA